MKRIFAVIILILATYSGTVTAASMPYTNYDDNGDASFVRQLVPKLLGRKAKGQLEIKLLTDIIQLHGREALVRALMERPEFNVLWTANIIDHMEMQRGGTNNSNGPTDSPACFAEKTPATLGLTSGVPEPGHLAQFVLNNDIDQTFSHKFNLHDLIDSAISLDNLFPAYRANIFPLANKSGSSNSSAFRARAGALFDRVYLNRDMSCIGCHRGTYSTSGVGQRTHPLYKSLDLAIFDHLAMAEYKPDIDEGSDYAVCKGCHGNNGTGGSYNGESVTGIRDASVDNIQAAISSVGAMSGLANLTDETIENIATLLKDPGAFSRDEISTTIAKHNAVFRRNIFPISFESDELINCASLPSDNDVAWAPWGMDMSCGCIAHDVYPIADGPEAAFFAGEELDADNASILDVDRRLREGYEDLGVLVPFLPLLDADGSAIGASDIPGEVALSYMLAAKITENIWEQLMGEPLTLVNQFARNVKQRDLHKYLTEDVFIQHDWSLKETIVAIVTSRYFNRRAPISSLADTPYQIPAVADPFKIKVLPCRDESEPAPIDQLATLSTGGASTAPLKFEPLYLPNCSFNTQGDLVHRYSPRELISAASSALGWPKATIRFGSTEQNTTYPSNKLNFGIGQYRSEIDPGFKEVNYQSLLIWDDTYGTCASSNAQRSDWIERFREGIDAFNAQHPAQPLTAGELVLSLKDWLIQEPVFGGYQVEEAPVPTPTPREGPILQANIPTVPPYPVQPQFQIATIDSSEAALVSTLLNLDMDAAISTRDVSDIRLRQLCGAYLRAPQFMLAGMVRGDTLSAPRYRVCNDAHCSYQDMCQDLAPSLGKLGHSTLCGKEKVYDGKLVRRRIPLEVVSSNNGQAALNPLARQATRSDSEIEAPNLTRTDANNRRRGH